MSLTALEWGLRAPITPRFGGNLGALPRLQGTEPKQQQKSDLKHKKSDRSPAQPTPLATSNPPLPFRSPVSGFSFFFTPILQILSSCQKFTQNPKSKINNPLLPDQQIS